MRGAPPCAATPGSRNQPGERRRDPQADPEGPEAVTSLSPLRGQRGDGGAGGGSGASTPHPQGPVASGTVFCFFGMLVTSVTSDSRSEFRWEMGDFLEG